MPETGFVAVFLIGLLGGTHCISMCGGIVGALTVNTPGGPVRRQWPMQLAYNLGRVSTYVFLGAAMGAVGSMSLLMNDVWPVQRTLYVLANVMLVALGLYLMGFTQLLMPLERAGGRLWQHVQPLTRRLLPAHTPGRALPLGMLWGFLPCGLVYSVMTASLLTGSAGRGAGLMLAFGLGTLPNLLLAGLVLQRFRGLIRDRRARVVSGLLVLGFGLFGLYHVGDMGGMLWQGVVCTTE